MFVPAPRDPQPHSGQDRRALREGGVAQAPVEADELRCTAVLEKRRELQGIGGPEIVRREESLRPTADLGRRFDFDVEPIEAPIHVPYRDQGPFTGGMPRERFPEKSRLDLHASAPPNLNHRIGGLQPDHLR